MIDLAMSGGPERVGHLPTAFTSLVGREQESVTVRELLVRPSVRLVTLTGAGGVGKTRLAAKVASELDSGCGFEAVTFVALAPVHDPRLVEVTIARTLGLATADEAVAETLRTHLGRRSMLLVLDNVEHLLDAGPVLADLLVHCPGLTLLVTSRARLRLSAEHIVQVAPLTCPDPEGPPFPSDLDRYPAVRLFVERCQAALPDFTLGEDNAAQIAEICRRLDGLPLAIELAAARTTILPPAAMLARLDRRLPVLTGGPRELPERLRTMRSGIAWSYDLLSTAEQSLFRRMGVFAGACTLAAMAAVVDPPDQAHILDLIDGLVDKSLVRRLVDGDGEPRFTMLETIREYAVEQLVTCGEDETARRAHAEFIRRFVDLARPGLRGPEQQGWRDVLEADLDDVRGALAWTLRDAAGPEEADNGQWIAGALWYFWFQRGLIGEGRRWLTRALDLVRTRGSGRAQALLGAATLAWRQGDCATAQIHLDESERLWRRLDDRRGLAEAWHVLGHVRFDQRDYDAARRLFTDSLASYRQANDIVGSLPLIGDLGLVAYHEGDLEAAESVWGESLTQYRRHGLKDRVAGVLNGLGDLARLSGERDRAAALYEESLSLWRDLRGTPGIASALHKLGQVGRSAGDTFGARARFVESLAMQRESGNQQGIGECLAGLAGVAADTGSPDRAARVGAAAIHLLESIGMPLAPADQAVLTRDLAVARERLTAAAWQGAWAAGTALSLAEAIALALVEETESPRRVITVSQLSRREREVSVLIAQGLTNRQISSALSISQKTVGSHIEHIMNKLELRSRTRIAVWAVAHGLTSEQDPSG